MADVFSAERGQILESEYRAWHNRRRGCWLRRIYPAFRSDSAVEKSDVGSDARIRGDGALGYGSVAGTRDRRAAAVFELRARCVAAVWMRRNCGACRLDFGIRGV